MDVDEHLMNFNENLCFSVSNVRTMVKTRFVIGSLSANYIAFPNENGKQENHLKNDMFILIFCF